MKVDISKGFDIGGLHFEVCCDGLRMQGEQRFGECSHLAQVITLRENLKPDAMSSTFIHETIEAINYQYSLELPHQSICALEVSLAQVLKSLGIEFAIEEK
jgi:hypothetical protein